MAGQVLIGALLGAALGGVTGGGGQAVAQGALAGATVGTAVAASGAPWAQLSVQEQFNVAYAQCMYSRGDQVPGYAAQQYALPPPPAPARVTNSPFGEASELADPTRFQGMKLAKVPGIRHRLQVCESSNGR
jgi:uncharacterized protein YcfJ